MFDIFQAAPLFAFLKPPGLGAKKIIEGAQRGELWSVFLLVAMAAGLSIPVVIRVRPLLMKPQTTRWRVAWVVGLLFLAGVVSSCVSIWRARRVDG